MENNHIVLGYGWHSLEGSDISWRWSSDVFSLFFNDCDNKHLSFHTAEMIVDNTTEIYARSKNMSDFVKIATINTKKGKSFKVDIDLNQIYELKFKTTIFNPSQDSIGNADSRKLGILVKSFTLISGNDSATFQMKDVPSSLDDVTYKNNVDINPYTDTYFKFPSIEKNKNNIDDYTVLLTCHGNRLEFGKCAYQSIIDAGIKNIVIVISGDDESYLNWARKVSNKHPVVFINNDINNNLCWIEGLKKVNTYWVTILHDDDIILPTVKDVVSCLDERCLFGVWNGCVENIANKKIELEKTIDLNLKSGIYRCALIKDQIIRYPHVISPIHGIFPTNKLIDCLTEWEKTHGKDDFFYEKSTFVVGNDIFIWSYFTKYNENLFFYSSEKCTKCISHNQSATQIDINRQNNKFSRIYSRLKNIHIKNDLKVGIIFYVHEYDNKIKQTFSNLDEFKLSKHSIPFVVYTDNSRLRIDNKRYSNFITFDEIPKMESGLYRTLDKYAFWAFIDGIRIAKEKGWDYFFIYEWDCKVNKDYWFDTLWQEHLSWPYKPIISGTPGIRMPKICIGNFLQSAQEYMYQYSKQCGVSMNIDIANPISVYTNGALTFYDTNEMVRYHHNELYTNIVNKSTHVDDVAPWDVGLGIRMFKDLKENCFKRIAWLPSSYSGCGDFCYNQQQREYMLKTNMKIAIHQNKYL